MIGTTVVKVVELCEMTTVAAGVGVAEVDGAGTTVVRVELGSVTTTV